MGWFGFAGRANTVRPYGIASPSLVMRGNFLFLLTEDTTLPIGMADGYTVWHVVIAVATVLVAVFSRTKQKDAKGEGARA